MKRIDRAMGGWFRQTVFEPALWLTLVLSTVIACFGDEKVLRSISIDVGSAQVHVGISLLGIVLAGLAILFVLLDDKYIKLLEQVPPGFDADLWPFKFTAFLAVICASFGMALMLLGNPGTFVFRLVFLLSLWSFAYLLWNMFQLVRFIAGHAKARMMQIQKNKHQE